MQTFRLLPGKTNKPSGEASPHPPASGRDKQPCSYGQSFSGQSLKFISYRQSAEALAHPHMYSCYGWRHLVWISMAASTSPVSVSASVYTWGGKRTRTAFSASHPLCLTPRPLSHAPQVPRSDLNAAIPFELIPKVTFDFRYDFSHFHMAWSKSL